MKEVNVTTRTTPARPRSGNYVQGTVVSGGGGGTTVISGETVDIVQTDDTKTLTDQNVLSSARSVQEFIQREGSQKIKALIDFLNGLLIAGKQANDIAVADDQGNEEKVKDTVMASTAWTKAEIEELDDKFLRKDQPDQTDHLVKFLGGLNVGEFIDSMVAGKGTGMFADGRIQAERLEVRSSLTVLELIYNRLSAMEGNYSFSESGTIETVTLMEDGTYTLKMRKRWENDFTALKQNDIIYGVVNDLASGSGEYYTSWARVLSVNTAANTLSVSLYHDSEVPGGKNYPPEPLMVVTRRGNPVDESRQSWWYLSSYEGCICMLDGVTKPVLEESNYSIIIGKLKHLSIFDNLPVNYLQSYVYCRGIAVQDILRVDYQGVIPRQKNDRGQWSAEVAASEEPYQAEHKADTGSGQVMLYDAVWHVGCEWMCLVTGTTDEPKYGCAGWAMIQGNPEFTVDITSTNGWFFDAEQFATTLGVVGMLYNQDVTDSLLDEDISWSRDTGDVTEDNAWTVAHAEFGKTLPLTLTDLGPNYMNLVGCKFIVKALLRDGQENKTTENYVAF